jgi:hypothetical protein
MLLLETHEASQLACYEWRVTCSLMVPKGSLLPCTTDIRTQALAGVPSGCRNVDLNPILYSDVFPNDVTTVILRNSSMSLTFTVKRPRTKSPQLGVISHEITDAFRYRYAKMRVIEYRERQQETL